MRLPKERRLLWGTVALILVVYAFLVTMLFAHRAWPFDSDGAVHAMEGLQLAADLRGGKIGNFFTHLYFHRWYPPLLSLYLTPFLTILGPSNFAARYPLLLLFPLNLALLYRVGRLLWRRWEAGMVALLLGATSPTMWMLALLCMEETLAMTGLLLVIAGYALSMRGKLDWIWTGMALALTFLARISTGAFAGIALLVVCCARQGTPREKIQVTGQVLGPLTVTAFFWWIHPYKFKGLLDYFLASAPSQPTFTWSLLTHYWEQLLSSDTVGWVIGLLVVISILLSIMRWKEPVVQLLLTLILITWGALVLKRQLAPRLFFAALPPAFLLTAFQSERARCVVALFERMEQQLIKQLRWIRTILISGFILYLLGTLAVRVLTFPFLMEVAYETDLRSKRAFAWIAQHAKEEKIFFVNGWDQFSAQGLSWYLAHLYWPHWEEDKVTGVDLQDPAQQPSEVDNFQQAVLTSPGATIVHLGNTPVPEAGAWWAYRSSLAACWDGEWEATATFWTRIWDSQLEREILAHPLRFLRHKDREATRQSLWYLLRFEVHVAACKE